MAVSDSLQDYTSPAYRVATSGAMPGRKPKREGTQQGDCRAPGITERAVKTYLCSIYGKLGVDSRASVVAKAVGSGLVPTSRRAVAAYLAQASISALDMVSASAASSAASSLTQ